jgi:hypothetical protein
VRVDDVGCPLHVKSWGGDVAIERAHAPFFLTTTGGDVRVDAVAPFSGACRVETTGGDVQVQLAAGQRGVVLASAAGGDVKVLGRRARGDVDLGAGDPRMELAVRTMGGDVRVERP